MKEFSACSKYLNCNKPATKGCGRCFAAQYCSKAHQIEHWPQHKAQCAEIAAARRRNEVLSLLENKLRGNLFLYAQSWGPHITVTFDEPLDNFLMLGGKHHVAFLAPRECDCKNAGGEGENAGSDCNRDGESIEIEFVFSDYSDTRRFSAPFVGSAIDFEKKEKDWFFMFTF